MQSTICRASGHGVLWRNGWALLALIIVGMSEACGAAANTNGTTNNCASGDVYCATCNGGSLCSHAGCPQIACPRAAVTADASADDAAGRGLVADASGPFSDADASGYTGADDAGASNGCPAALPNSCLDCNGGVFCVSGSCPPTNCPSHDAGVLANDGPTNGSSLVCPGTSPPPAGYQVCRSQADCQQFWSCTPEPQVGCGACFRPPNDCMKDGDCALSGAVCEPVVLTGPCLCGSPNGTQCMARCPGRTCAAGNQCSATGHCQPTRCDQGYACPSDFSCKPTDATADAHGCGVTTCADGLPCGADQECDRTSPRANAIGCAPMSCTHGYACPAGWACMASPYADPHDCFPPHCTKSSECGVNETCDPTQPFRGCVARKCARDGDCDCGACVQGTCSGRLWVCSGPPPP